ncbi:MAG: hypothetical protein AB1782_17865 [Cyanobacteriota bacterium]
MNKSFITYDDIYLILKPFTLDPKMIVWAVFVIAIAFGIYKWKKPNVSTFHYVLLSVLIVINSFFLLLFVVRMYQETGRFKDLSHKQAIKEITSEDFNKVYDFLDSKIGKNQTYYFYNPTDPYHENVRTKFRLAYYLAPRKISADIAHANYIIVVNFKNKSKIDIPVPENKEHIIHKITKNITIIELKTKPAKLKVIN